MDWNVGMRNASGNIVAAIGFVVMVVPYGWNEFTIVGYVAALALVSCAATAFLRVPPAIQVAAYAIAGLASLDIVRLSFGAMLEVTVFSLIAAGLLFAAWTRLHGGWRRHGILLAALGAGIYLVHDVIVGYEQQLPADALLLVGFALLWLWPPTT